MTMSRGLGGCCVLLTSKKSHRKLSKVRGPFRAEQAVAYMSGGQVSVAMMADQLAFRPTAADTSVIAWMTDPPGPQPPAVTKKITIQVKEIFLPRVGTWNIASDFTLICVSIRNVAARSPAWQWPVRWGSTRRARG